MEDDDIDDLEMNGLPPGQPLFYNRGSQPPQFVNVPPLPNAFYQKLEKLEQQFITISGVSEISRNSSAPSSSTSGVAMAILSEKDETRISLSRDRIKDTVVLIGEQWLRLYKQFATSKRLLRIGGNETDIALIEWDRNDLTAFDIKVEADDGLANSPALRREFLMTMVSQGLLNNSKGEFDTLARMKFFEQLEIGTFSDLFSEAKLQIVGSQKENILFSEEEILPDLYEYHDDDIHLTEHNKFRLSGDFINIINNKPDLAMEFDKHCQLHEQQRAMKLQKQMAQMQPQIM
jgi:hypothetical protein